MVNIVDFNRNFINNRKYQSNSNSESSEFQTLNRSDRFNDRNRKYESVKKLFVNMRLTGLLAEEANMYKGVKIVYNEPAEAELSQENWRLFTFKGNESLPTIYLHRQSAFLIGKLEGICEIFMSHPSINEQHAVIQFRKIEDYIKPYIIDLNSTNGSFINGIKIEAQKYYELRENDVLKFGFSSRDYVLLTEKSSVSFD